MNFMNFITEYWSSILVFVIFVVACIILVKKGYTPYVKQMLFYLVVEAEKQFGSGTGVLKYAVVATWLYDKLPTLVRFFFTEKQIDKLIESAVTEMKEWLSVNEKANSLVVKSE